MNRRLDAGSTVVDPIRKVAIGVGSLLLTMGVALGAWMGASGEPAKKTSAKPVAIAHATPTPKPVPHAAPTTHPSPPAEPEPTKPEPTPPKKPVESPKMEPDSPEPKKPEPPKPEPKKPESPKPDPKKPEPKPPEPKKPEPKPVAKAVTFASVMPIFQAHCVSCHSASTKRGGLDMSSLAAIMKGGNGGDEVKPGNADGSWLWSQIDGDSMPPDGKTKLTADQKKLVKDWILAGAK